jgi:peptide/nickel transport system substrate-binding protein
MKPEAPFNYTNDEELSSWLKAARSTVDEAKRKELYYKVQNRIVDQAYWMPFFVQHEIQGANKHFQYDLGVDQIPRWQYGSWKE